MRQEGDGAPPEPAKTNRPTTSEPSMVASKPIELGHLASSKPLMAAPKSAETFHLAPSEPSVVPPKSMKGGHVVLSEPSKLREGSKHPHMMAVGVLTPIPLRLSLGWPGSMGSVHPKDDVRLS